MVFCKRLPGLVAEWRIAMVWPKSFPEGEGLEPEFMLLAFHDGIMFRKGSPEPQIDHLDML